jgi:hypothetical protein
MRYIAWAVLISATLGVCACSSPEQPPAKPAPSAATGPVPPAAATPLPVRTAPDKPAVKSSTVPDFIVLEASQGQVTLPHRAHAKELHCATCHSEIEPGKVAWDKDTAHAYCRDCHLAKGAGPTSCVECHKK